MPIHDSIPVPTVPRCLAAACLAALLAPSVGASQVPEHEGEIEGVVRDAETGRPLAESATALESAVQHGRALQAAAYAEDWRAELTAARCAPHPET